MSLKSVPIKKFRGNEDGFWGGGGRVTKFGRCRLSCRSGGGARVVFLGRSREANRQTFPTNPKSISSTKIKGGSMMTKMNRGKMGLVVII